MLPVIGTLDGGGTIGPTRIVADGEDSTQSFYIWGATLRSNLSGTGTDNKGYVEDEATRTASNCYIRGLRERITIETHGAAAWKWRRIVFATFGSDLFRDDALNVHLPWTFGTNGVSRLVADMNTGDTATNTIRDKILSALFRGVEGVDWYSTLTAPTDKRRLKILSDRVRTINSGNNFGCMRDFRIWLPINKYILYDDDQQGGRQVMNVQSALDTKSLGDVYVLDIFEPTKQSSDQDWLDFLPEARLYWHER